MNDPILVQLAALEVVVQFLLAIDLSKRSEDKADALMRGLLRNVSVSGITDGSAAEFRRSLEQRIEHISRTSAELASRFRQVREETSGPD